MGFLRKIGTHFMQISRYKLPESNISKISNIYQIKKQLLTQNELLPFPITITSRTLNSDLTLSFQ